MNTKLVIFLLLVTSASLLTSCVDDRASAAVGTDAPAVSSPLDDAIQQARALAEKASDSPAAHVKLASLYIKKARATADHKMNVAAADAIDNALAIDPKNVDARKLKAALLATDHQFPEALAASSALVKEFPTDPFAYGIIVDSSVEVGNYADAIKAAQTMVDLRPNSASYARVALVRSLHGDHSGAVEMYTKAAKTADPLDPEARSWCLLQLAAQHFKGGDLPKATAAVDESLQISGSYPNALIFKARLLATNGDLAGAEALLAQANSNVTQTEALILLGDIRTKGGRTTEVEDLYRQAEENAKATDGDLHRFALLWADRGMRLNESLAIAEADYGTNKDIYASDIYAWSLFKNGKIPEAKAMIEKALRPKAGDARILFHAGMIHKAAGDMANAKKFLRAALEANQHFDFLHTDELRSTLAEMK